jgi:large subunit ribosomal protein L21
MFAVIKTGGKQYRVAAGDVVKIESLPAGVGEQVVLADVVAVTDGANVRVGNPTVSGASVKATVMAHGRHPKVTIFKMRRRKHFKKQAGHRQNYTQVRVDAVVG